jgi:hypothetical protein
VQQIEGMVNIWPDPQAGSQIPDVLRPGNAQKSVSGSSGAM